jgi:hypothetical protein
MASLRAARPRAARPRYAVHGDAEVVKAHVTHILTKAGPANRTQIALLAHDAGLA